MSEEQYSDASIGAFCAECGQRYEVARRGDTLESISLRTNIPVCMLQRANELHPLFRSELNEGDTIKVPNDDYCKGREPCERYILEDLIDYDLIADEGDTIYSISSETGVPVRLILLYNDMGDGDDLPGIIYIPDVDGFKKITVMPGDTIGSIADEYDIPEHILMFINALLISTLYPGQQLLVPCKE